MPLTLQRHTNCNLSPSKVIIHGRGFPFDGSASFEYGQLLQHRELPRLSLHLEVGASCFHDFGYCHIVPDSFPNISTGVWVRAVPALPVFLFICSRSCSHPAVDPHTLILYIYCSIQISVHDISTTRTSVFPDRYRHGLLLFASAAQL